MIKNVLPLSLIIALRFLGLFIVMPTLSIYALSLEGSNELLVGIVIGGYALTQMLFQVPFGIFSDRFGRKIAIVIGLLLFALGSVICALADSITILIIGRFLQGAGAIGAVISAMISDIVKEEQRAKAMALMGGSIALSFALSMLLGPLIGGYFGADILFWLTAFLSLIALGILMLKVPPVPKITYHISDENRRVLSILKQKNLLRMNITNFLQKGMMTLAFLIIPIVLVQEYGYLKQELYKVYIPAMIFGLFAMPFAVIFGEKKAKPKQMLIIGIALFGLSFFVMGGAHSSLLFISGVILFFIGFNIHEPLLQSLTSKFAKAHQKGAALGVFNSFGYLGTFLGGVFGGLMLKNYGIVMISSSVVIISLLWIVLIYAMPNPARIKNLYLKLSEIDEKKRELLLNTQGVVEHYANETEGLLIVKYNSKDIDEESLKQLLA